MMRHASGVLLHIFAIVLAPYFVHFCDSWVEEGHDERTCVASYASSAIYVLIVMLLYHVQQDLVRGWAARGVWRELAHVHAGTRQTGSDRHAHT